MMINEEMYLYMRSHPKWYLILSRYPDKINDFINQYHLDTHTTMNDYIHKIETIIQMIEMFI
ncbi:MAG: hypothetical protein LUG60_14635 [Erysipelotrichaceae bacterium]|nr:hypothetical protein [Erysipelotrichaceae bacterium]